MASENNNLLSMSVQFSGRSSVSSRSHAVCVVKSVAVSCEKFVIASKDSVANFSEFSDKIVAAIQSLEERVSALATGDRQVVRIGSVPAAAAADVLTLTKPGHADQLKFYEDVKRIAAFALEWRNTTRR